jgi:hypothetical protein
MDDGYLLHDWIAKIYSIICTKKFSLYFFDWFFQTVLKGLSPPF